MWESGHSVITILIWYVYDNPNYFIECYDIAMVHVQKHGIYMVVLSYSISLLLLLLLWAQEEQLP